MPALRINHHFAQFLLALELSAGLHAERLQRRFQTAAGQIDVAAFQAGGEHLRRNVQSAETTVAVIEVNGLFLRADLIDLADRRVLLEPVADRIGKASKFPVTVAIGPDQQIARVRAEFGFQCAQVADHNSLPHVGV